MTQQYTHSRKWHFRLKRDTHTTHHLVGVVARDGGRVSEDLAECGCLGCVTLVDLLSDLVRGGSTLHQVHIVGDLREGAR